MYALLCLSNQGVGEFVPCAVLVDDVALKVNVTGRSRDGGEPCGIVLRCINQQSDAIAVNQRCTGGA
jgi:hypothetical protein